MPEPNDGSLWRHLNVQIPGAASLADLSTLSTDLQSANILVGYLRSCAVDPAELLDATEPDEGTARSDADKEKITILCDTLDAF